MTDAGKPAAIQAIEWAEERIKVDLEIARDEQRRAQATIEQTMGDIARGERHLADLRRDKRLLELLGPNVRDERPQEPQEPDATT